jgi:hypothetical protein
LETREEHFIALATEVHAGSALPGLGGLPSREAELPRCLAAFAGARHAHRKAFALSAALLVVIVAELAVLLLLPGPTPLVVWEDKSQEMLVRMP